jgi:predicted transcriptional regulator of viral defense system
MPQKPAHTLSQAKRAQSLLAERGMVRLREFIAVGIAEETLSRLVKQGSVVRLSRGLYQLAGTPPASAHSMAEATKLVPKGVVCLISALQFHELTTQLPSSVWMAVGRTAWKPKLSYPPVRFVRFGDLALTTGIETHTIEGVSVRIFSAAKTVVDCFRYRTKVGTDVAIEALRMALRKQQCTPNDIWKLAKSLRALTVIRPYLESATSDAA